MPLFRLALSLLLVLGTSLATAQTKPRIEKAADLPRFTYKLDAKVEDVVRSRRSFAAVRRRAAAGYRVGARRLRHRRQADPARSARTCLPRSTFSMAGTTVPSAHGRASARCRTNPPTSCCRGCGCARWSRRRKAHGVGARGLRARGRRRSRRTRADAVRGDRERHQGSQGRRRDRSARARSRLPARGGAADGRQERRAVARSSRPALSTPRFALMAVLPLEADAGRHLQRLPRCAQGRQARHLGRARRRRCRRRRRASRWRSPSGTAASIPRCSARQVHARQAEPAGLIAFDKYSRPAEGELMPLPPTCGPSCRR